MRIPAKCLILNRVIKTRVVRPDVNEMRPQITARYKKLSSFLILAGNHKFLKRGANININMLKDIIIITRLTNICLKRYRNSGLLFDKRGKCTLRAPSNPNDINSDASDPNAITAEYIP